MLPAVSKTEMLTEGGMKPGARIRETRTVGGKERSAVIEEVEHQRPGVHKADADMMGMHAAYTFRFSRNRSGTRVEMQAEVTGNLLWKLFLGMIEREDGEYLTRLKAAMEKTV
jgi:hypothetical protein